MVAPKRTREFAKTGKWHWTFLLLDLVPWQFGHASIALGAKEKCNKKGRHEKAPTDKSVKAQVTGTHDDSDAVG